MGFFKSSKPPQAPLPNLALSLSTPQDKVFKPNDNISGDVSLSTPSAITPQAIEVSLWGQSSVWIRTSHSSSNSTTGTSSTDYRHYRDIAPLFTVTFNLFPNPHPLQTGQNYTFPFRFRVPEGTGYNRSGCYKKDDDETWTVFPHDLPPTFFFGPAPDEPDNASISYGVTARLICAGVGIGKNLEPLSVTAPIVFLPLNPNAQRSGPLSVVRYPKRFTLASSSLTGQDPSSIGFRQRVSDKFSSSTPKLDFDATLEIPDLLTSGSEFRFRASLNVIEKSKNVVQIPAITFKVLKLELLDFTFFRAPRDWNASTHRDGHQWRTFEPSPNSSWSGQEHTIYREKKTRLNCKPESQVLHLDEVSSGEKKEIEQASSCEHWFTARVPGYISPSFQSFAITRAYRIKVKLGVEIGGKKFEFETESHIRYLGSAPGEYGV